jgi:hypothetical protein
MNRSQERKQIMGAHHADHSEEDFGIDEDEAGGSADMNDDESRGAVKRGDPVARADEKGARIGDEVEEDDARGGGRKIGVRAGGRVEYAGHDLSTGKGPHTKAQPKGDMGASVAGVGEAKAAEAVHTREHVSQEHDQRMAHSDQGGKAGEGSSMSGVGDARRAQARKQKDDLDEQLGEHAHVSSGPRGIKRVSVDADHVMGDGASLGAGSAEGFADMASSKANRKEAMEPEREMNEKAAMGRERTVPTKNTMGHGERETIAKHTI